MSTTRFVSTLVAGALIGIAALASSVRAQSKEIIFLAGPKDHGAPGRHEYVKDLTLLAKCLETSTNLKGYTTRVIVGRAPRDLNEFKNAAAIVILSDSDRDAHETHPLFPPDPSTNHRGYDAETAAFLKGIDDLTKKGMGVVVFHYAVWAENFAARTYYMNWLGGLWVQGVSKNPVDQWAMSLKNDGHPIQRGVHPWTYREEVFSRFFLPDDPRRTDLLLATPEKNSIGPQIASWAFQREDGGRGFVMGGIDFHDNWKIEEYRRFILNGIVWAGHGEVPATGVASTLPEDWQK